MGLHVAVSRVGISLFFRESTLVGGPRWVRTKVCRQKGGVVCGMMQVSSLAIRGLFTFDTCHSDIDYSFVFHLSIFVIWELLCSLPFAFFLPLGSLLVGNEILGGLIVGRLQ